MSLDCSVCSSLSNLSSPSILHGIFGSSLVIEQGPPNLHKDPHTAVDFRLHSPLKSSHTQTHPYGKLLEVMKAGSIVQQEKKLLRSTRIEGLNRPLCPQTNGLSWNICIHTYMHACIHTYIHTHILGWPKSWPTQYIYINIGNTF